MKVNALVLTLLLTACGAPAGSTTPGGSAGYGGIPRMRVNQLAIQLDLPLFWAEDADGDDAIDPDEVRTLLFYPSAQGGFFLKGGLGLASIEVDFGALNFEDEGVGLTIGLGFDARVGRNFALTPYFDILTSSFDGASFNQVAFGLGFTWP